MKTIKKKYIIEVEYANEWQYELHDKSLSLILMAWRNGLLGENPFQIPASKNKKNKVEITSNKV